MINMYLYHDMKQGIVLVFGYGEYGAVSVVFSWFKRLCYKSSVIF